MTFASLIPQATRFAAIAFPVILLSACEVGRSTLRGGEELIGMTAAWLHAGSRCVIASAAAINDAVAHDVLVEVHRHLASGTPPATALARALTRVDPAGPPAPAACGRGSA